MASAWFLALMLDASAAPRWRAPAECPDGAALIAMVRGYGGSTDAIRIEGLILSGDAGYRLELVLDDGVRRETRTLHARECGALVRATALVIAVGTDPVDVARQQQVDAIVPPPPVPVESSPIVEPAPATTGRRRSTTGAPRPPNARATSASRAWHGWFGIGGGVERAALPGVSGGVIGLVAARRRGLGLELGGMWLAPRSTAGSVGRVRVQLGAVALRGCPELVVGRVSFPLCLGVEVGAMRGDGRGAPGARTVVATWLAAVASAGARLGFGRVALLLRGETAIAALRPGFELREPGDPIALFTPELASVRLWLGVELRVGRASRERGLRSGRRPSPGLWSEFAVARRRKPANLENRRRMRSG